MTTEVGLVTEWGPSGYRRGGRIPPDQFRRYRGNAIVGDRSVQSFGVDWFSRPAQYIADVAFLLPGVKSLGISFGYLIAMTFLLPMFRLVSFCRDRRAVHRSGHCSRCGYDLRATPDRCPECGMEPSK